MSIVFLLTPGVSPGRNGESISVVYDDGRSPETLPVYKAEKGSEEIYLKAAHVAKIFRATQFWNASSRKIVLGIENTRFVLTVDTRVVLLDGEITMLRNPVLYQDGSVMIPMEFIVEVASHHTPLSFSWDRASMVLRVEGVGYNVTGLSFTTTANRSKAVITLKEPLLYHMDANTPGLVRLKLYGGRIDAGKFRVKEAHGLFNGARAEQTERDAYIYFDIKKYASRLRVEKMENPPRIVIILEKGELPEIPEPEFASRKTLEILDEAAGANKSLKIEKIVLDPGHGGKDFGKVGKGGVMEKDVNLELAKVTADVLRRELGVEVVLTREDDRLLSLTRRTEIANEENGDIFISIHCNSWFSDEIGGFEAYFLSPPRTEWDRAVAEAENKANSSPGVDDDIEFILWDMVQNEFINESSFLAELIQKEMSGRLEIRNRGVKQANFTVLQGAKMPAVLIETAFLSNPKEETLLQDPSFQLEVARGIAAAIKKFKSKYQYSMNR